MAKNSHKEILMGAIQRFSAKSDAFSQSKLFRYSLPILGGIIIGFLTALMMRFAGKHFNF